MVTSVRGELRNEQKVNRFYAISICTKWRQTPYQMAPYTTRRILGFCEKFMKLRETHHFFELSAARAMQKG